MSEHTAQGVQEGGAHGPFHSYHQTCHLGEGWPGRLKQQLDHPGRALAPADLVGPSPSSLSFPRELLWLPGPLGLVLVAP